MMQSFTGTMKSISPARATAERLRLSALAATVCIGGLIVPAAANAQGAGASSADVSEIIVTARKRQETLLDVPVVETVLTRERLDKAQVVNLQDIAKIAPGLAVSDSILAIGTQISLRGVGTSTLDPGVDQSISLNIDGLSLSQGLAFGAGTFDLGQVEVLKGPQALFYGKSSPGGVISLRTADPTNKFEVIGRAAYEAEARERRGELIISGPLSDTVKARLAGMYSKSDGFFKNAATALPGYGGLNPSKRAGGSDSYIVRGTMLWNPSDALDVRAKANVAHDKVEWGGLTQAVFCPDGVGGYPGIPGALPAIPFMNPNENCKEDRTVYAVGVDPAVFPGVKNGGVPYNDMTQKFGTVEINGHPSDALTFTSTTGYYHVRSDGMYNISQSSYAGPILTFENQYRRREFTQEFRANSDFVGPINFTGGLFYQDGHVTNFVPLRANRSAIYFFGALGGGDSASYHDLNIDSLSAFGQLRFKPVEEFEIAAGGRYTSETRRDDTFLYVGYTAGGTMGVKTPSPLPIPKISSNNFSPELTLTYKPSADLTIFAAAKKGYKSGSFNLSPVVPGLDKSYGDEKVEGGEVGLKSRLLDRRLALNVAGYYYTYSGLQVGAVKVVTGGVQVTNTVNAGKARVYGVDFDAAYRPEVIDGLNLRAGVAWNHARFVELNNVPCYFGQLQSEGCNQVLNPTTGLFTAQSLNGSPLVRAPDWQGTIGFDYDMPLGNSMTLTFTNDTQFASRSLTNLGKRPDFFQKGYIRVDAGVTLKGRDDRWEIALIGKNINNEIRSGYCPASNTAFGLLAINPGFVLDDGTGGTTRGRGGSAEGQCVVDRGRSIWLRLTLRPFN